MACGEKRTITVKAKRDATSFSGFDFEMFENGQKVPGDSIESNKDGKGKAPDYHTFTFKLENDPDPGSGTDLKFVGNPFDVMWVKPGSETHAGDCPKKRTGDPDFCVAEVTADTLTVHNANSRKCKYKFVLNFVGTKADGSQGMVSYDPVWTNGNGGSSD